MKPIASKGPPKVGIGVFEQWLIIYRSFGVEGHWPPKSIVTYQVNTRNSINSQKNKNAFPKGVAKSVAHCWKEQVTNNAYD
eukprot:3323592-Amphidinium_carterae.1